MTPHHIITRGNPDEIADWEIDYELYPNKGIVTMHLVGLTRMEAMDRVMASTDRLVTFLKVEKKEPPHTWERLT